MIHMIDQMARGLGFEGARPVNTEDFNGTYLVLVTRCDKTAEPGSGTGFVSHYYAASNSAYHRTRELANKLNERQIAAKAHPGADIKRLMVAAGWGRYGKNSLVYSPRYGSYMAGSVIALQTRLDIAATQENAEILLDCGDCVRCVQACPTGALDGQGRVNPLQCLRWYESHPEKMPAAIREKMGRRILGCEICQKCCPRNAHIAQKAYGEKERRMWNIARLLQMDDASLPEIADTIGSNYAARSKLRALAALAAAADDDTENLQMLEKAAQDASGAVSELAAWALGKRKHLAK
ncbi:MAG: epoxyqueuosine reductase [Christensenellales bacterium]|jgi:epoxyqueuosine reductase QueG